MKYVLISLIGMPLFSMLFALIGCFTVIYVYFMIQEGWHLAELFHVQCVVTAPYVVPYRYNFNQKLHASR